MADLHALLKTAFTTAKEIATTTIDFAPPPPPLPVQQTQLQEPVYKSTSLLPAILTGAFFKLYDDFSDLQILPDNHFVMEFFKVAITAFTTLFLLQDFYITIIFLILSVLEITLKSADTTFWKAGILIPTICFLLHLPNFIMPSASFIGILIALVALFLFIVYIEKITFPEETSVNKLLNRCAIFVCAGLMIYNKQIYIAQPYIPLMGGWTAGYMGVYVITHLYALLTTKPPAPHEE